jgi:ribosome-associated heat shock protein Hsp15
VAPPCAGQVHPDRDNRDPEALQARVDKWLWAARLFKTRSLAAAAADRGHVEVNGARAKPARTIAPGDIVSFQKGPLPWKVVVRVISLRRGPASEAVKLYDEDPEVKAARDALVEQRRAEARKAAGFGRVGPRPSKRDRRRIEQFRDDSWRDED